MLSKIFIQNPVMTNVIALIMVLLGGLSLTRLPVALYPNITPPTVEVNATWPGATATAVAKVVGAPLEEQINGLERVLYLSSKSSDNGDYALTVTFELGTDVDMATVLLQNRVNSALASLPQEVQRQGVTVTKSSPAMLLVVALQSPDGSRDSLYLANYASLHVQPVLARAPGVGQVGLFGAARYAMRVWLDVDRMTSQGVSFDEINAAIEQQNVQVAAGRIGGEPSSDSQAFQYTIVTEGLLDSPEAFASILIKVLPDGRVVHLSDVARIELGAQNYDLFAKVHSNNAALLAVYERPGANALETAQGIRARMDELAAAFPPGISWAMPFDTTTFVSFAVHQVYGTFFKATLLVMAVVFMFLQNWRATLGPAMVIPVTLLGAFLGMDALGFSVNSITLFALVLAIGLVVDDAIIVVEATMRHLEGGSPPQEAAMKGIADLFLPLVAVTLVFASVFLPAASLGGISGQLYRQFALVIGCTAMLSAVFALTLNPTECALWLRPLGVPHGPDVSQSAIQPSIQSAIQPSIQPSKRGLNASTLFGVFTLFNKGYAALQGFMMGLTAAALRAPCVALLVYAAIAGGAVWGYAHLQQGFLPQEDQGYLLVSAQLAPATAQPRTRDFAAKLEQVFARVEGIEDWVIMGGSSLLTGADASNAITAFVIFESFQKRGTRLSEGVIMKALQHELAVMQHELAAVQHELTAAQYEQASGQKPSQTSGHPQNPLHSEILVVPPPPIMGMGNAGGFELMVEDRAARGALALEKAVRQLEQAAASNGHVQGVLSLYSASTPQVLLSMDRAAAMSHGVSLPALFKAVQTSFGGNYINQFNMADRNFQVLVQADAPFRGNVKDMAHMHVRNNQGQEVPLLAFASVHPTAGPSLVTRYNLYTAASVQGQPATGVSSGTAMAVMEQLARDTLPKGFGVEWTSMALQEADTKGQEGLILGMALVLVYLILTALYANWLLPVGVLLVIPLALSGAVGGILLRGMESNVYVQIGLLLLIAMSTKNALILMHYAKGYVALGMPLVEAAQKAASVRFRPILMSSLAFAAGSLPLLWATGAGAASQRYLGTTIFGGMLATALLTVVFAPLFFVGFARPLKSWFARTHEERVYNG